MDAMAVAKAIFSALTLVITLQGFVQAQDSLCPLEPVVIHLSRGQKVTISYHVNHGVEQDIVQVPKVTRRPFGSGRIPSTTTGPLVTDDLDPYEGNGTTHPSTATPHLKDASNVTQTTIADVVSTTFESRNETEITTSHILSTANVEYSALANETSQGNETVTVITELSSPNVLVGVVSTTLEVQSSTLPSSTVKNEDLLTTVRESELVENRDELTTVNVLEAQTTTENHVVTTLEVSTEEAKNENSTTEASTSSNLTVQSTDSTTQTSTENVENENSTSGSVENENSTTENVQNKNSTTEQVHNENSTTEQGQDENSTTEQVQNDNSTTETVENKNSTTEAIFTSDLTTESELTTQTSTVNVEVKDALNDEDKAEEVTDEPMVSDKPIDTVIEEDFGGEVEDESENNDTSTSSVIKSTETSPVPTTLVTSSSSVDEEAQTSANDSFLNDASQLDSNMTTTRADEITTTTQNQKRKLVPISVDDDDDSSSVTVAQQTTEVTDLSSLPLSESDKSLLADLTSITQREFTESTTAVNLDDEEIELNETHVNTTNIDDLDDEEIILNSTNVNQTTTNDDDEFEDENENEDENSDREEETLLQPILDQILANNVTDESRDGRVVDSSNSTSSEVEEEPQYDEETDDEEKETEEEVAHADDTHSYADGTDLGPDIVKREAEKLRSDRWRRTLRYHVQPNITLCEWHFKTDPGVPLLLSFKNYSIPISERCEDHHIAVRRSNGYVARWCGKAKETPSHTTFARQELHLLLYSENGPAETGFVAEIQALDTFLLRKAVHKVRPLFSQTSARH